MKYTKFFADLKKDDTDIAGGKGASLGEMINAKIPVPNGFVVLSTTFDKFIKSKKLDTKIQKILASVKNEDSKSGQKASKDIQKLILNETIPTGIKKEIKTCFDKLDSQYVAVRSSATAEDGIEHAWAGQLDTFLNTTQDSLFENIKKCWASLFTERAIFYRFEKGLEKNHISVAVVVQEMVNSEKSGIAFSVHPVTENRGEMIIEAGFGLGEAIVSGSVTPDSFVVSKSKNEIIENFIAVQSKALYKKEAGGNEWVDLEEKGELQAISDSEVLELSKIIKRIENHYKLPQDIEWAYADNKFYITQSRPITTLSKSNIKVFTKFASRQYSVTQMDSYHDALLDNFQENFSYSTCPLFIYNTDKNLVEIYFEQKELKKLFQKIGEHVSQKEVFKNIVKDFKDSTKEIVPFLEGKSVTKEELEELYNLFKRFYRGLSYMWVLPGLDNVSEKLKKDAMTLREETEKYSSQRDDLFINVFSKLYPEIGKKAAFISLKEVLSGLDNNELLKRANERSKGFIYYNREIISGNKAHSFLSDNDLMIEDESVSDREISAIEGTVAQVGKASGTVKIVFTSKDLSKINKGDILVSPMTRPEFLPAMKKTVAFITDEGGVTCHAAIVSREMKKPCIIGTKNATSILKDGDLVEVDADNGVIKILENSNDLNPALEINPSDYRFIGLWKEDLFPAYFWSSWFNKEKTKELGFDELTTGGALVLKRGDFFLHFETQEAMKSLLNRAIKTKDISLFKNLYKTSNKVCKDVIKKTDKLAQKSPTAKNFEQFVELGRDLMYYWAFGALMSGYIDEHIVNFALSENIPAEDIAQYVEISETELMRQQKELYDFYAIFKKRNWLTRIENDKQNLVKDIKKDKELFKKINAHIKKYGWIEMLNYIGNILNFDRLLTMIGSVKDKKTQKVRKKKVSEDFQFILDIAAFIGYSRQSGAEYSSIFSYKLNNYLNNTANKLNISFREMLYLTPDEIIHFLKEDKNPKPTIKKRQNGDWLIYGDKNEQVKVSDNDTVIKDLKEKMVPKAQKNSTVINGQIGNKGLVKGRVSIVMATDDFYKFKDGDILVTTMTTPDFIILMQKSKAIVTDIGGLLSHASIVSRELDKPCIIGTKFATQILKDGDLIEVDANNGIVKILKRNEE